MNQDSEHGADQGATADGAHAGGPETGAVSATPATGWRRNQGKATTTLLLRHGQTPLSVERRFAGRGDIPLTELGLEQAAAAAVRLAARGGVDLVLTSPLAR